MTALLKKLALILPIIVSLLYAPATVFAQTSFSQSVIAGINQQRAAYGLKPLSENGLLDLSASRKASDMLNRNYWGHVSPQGVYPWTLIDQAGYRYISAGENLGRGYFDPQAQVTGWMNSSGHRENILNPRFRNAGVSFIDGTFQGEQTRIVVLHLAN